MSQSTSPLEKDEQNEDPSNTTIQSNKIIDTLSLEHNTETSTTILLEKNNENNNENNNEINESISNSKKQESQQIQLHLEKRKEHIGNEENGENGKLNSRKEANLEETTKREEKEKMESKKEKEKKEKSGKPPKKKVSSDLDFILKPQNLLPNLRSFFTDSKIEDSEEKIKNTLSNEENVHQGQKKRCKCAKKNEKKESRLRNDDISQISSELNPDLDSEITFLPKKISFLDEVTDLKSTTAPKTLLTRRDNRGGGPKYPVLRRSQTSMAWRRTKTSPSRSQAEVFLLG
ncbi:uncharacterized protein DDB_G0285917-like [Belonocnema kinseyi]|uniref:uncharacterized protein DDB_G0285917-like n=1 Tax=Belonocnema kinseyi TaxID=2817044 RepID=UPI00143DC988|nr:uncharacterized protein DDB_G0285917-like [Belonocnema kinseyi]